MCNHLWTSFGHAATLPRYMAAAGQDRYLMMRPQDEEMDLPDRVFRWRGDVDGPQVVTFRIARAYCAFGVRRGEHMLVQAQVALDRDSNPEAETDGWPRCSQGLAPSDRK